MKIFLTGLIFLSAVAPRAVQSGKFRVRVIVGTYQCDRLSKPKVQPAGPGFQSFFIKRRPK